MLFPLVSAKLHIAAVLTVYDDITNPLLFCYSQTASTCLRRLTNPRSARYRGQGCEKYRPREAPRLIPDRRHFKTSQRESLGLGSLAVFSYSQLVTTPLFYALINDYSKLSFY